MSEDVEPLRARQAKERHKPQHDTKGKKPEFFRHPKTVPHGRAGERGEEGLCEHPGGRQEENADNELYPALGNVSGHRSRRGELQAAALPIASRFLATSALGGPTLHSSLLIQLSAAEISAGARVNLDRLAFLDEKGHLDDLASLERGRLLHVVGAVAPHSLGGLSYPERDR